MSNEVKTIESNISGNDTPRAQTKMPDVRAGDTIRPNGINETWTVAGVYEFGHVVNAGWPTAVLRPGEYTVVGRCDDAVHVEMLERVAKSRGDSPAYGLAITALLKMGKLPPEPPTPLDAALARVKELERRLEEVYEREPSLRKDWEFDGYFVHWNDVAKSCSRAWGGNNPGWGESPFELICQIINERDEAVDGLRAIGKAIGCGHTDDYDGRQKLVKYVRDTVEDLKTKLARVTLWREDGRKLIQHLLARIFRDGGQRTETHKTLADAVEEADKIVAETYGKLEEVTRERDAERDAYKQSRDGISYANGKLHVQCAAMVEVLEWYAEQAANCRKITSEGDTARHALDSDGGKRARTILASIPEEVKKILDVVALAPKMADAARRVVSQLPGIDDDIRAACDLKEILEAFDALSFTPPKEVKDPGILAMAIEPRSGFPGMTTTPPAAPAQKCDHNFGDKLGGRCGKCGKSAVELVKETPEQRPGIADDKSVTQVSCNKLPAWWVAFLQNIAELDGRTSPDDEPDALVATDKELENCYLRAVELEDNARDDAKPVEDKPATAVPDPELRAMHVLAKHHKWHLEQAEPGEHGIVLADSYQESELCDETIDALRMPLSSALEPPLWVVDILLRRISCHHIQHHGFGPIFEAAMKLRKQKPAEDHPPVAPVEELTFAALREANESRCVKWHNGETVSLEFRMVELAGEAGEACNAAKKIARLRMGIKGGVDATENLSEELADTVICCDLAAQAAGINLGKAVARKFNATSEKHGFSERLSILNSLPESVVGAKTSVDAKDGGGR